MPEHLGPIRIGIIGLGRAGRIHFEAIRDLPGAMVAAACDPEAQARSVARDAGVETYTNLSDMLQNAELDAAIICTPPTSHATTSLACLERGWHVVCEKPLALTTWDVLRMLQTANRLQRRILVASKFRHVPQITHAREMLNSGELGEAVSFEVSFASTVDMSSRWNSRPDQSGGGVVIDNGCHAFDIASFFFGAIHRVHATCLKRLQAIEVEDSATIQMWAGDDVVGNVDLSWSLVPARDSYFVLHGSRGTLEIGWQESRVKSPGKSWQKFGGMYDKIEAHRSMHRTFIRSILNGTAAWISAPECLQVVAAVDAAYRSLSSGTIQSVAIQGTRELSLVSLSAIGNPESLVALS